MLVTGVILPRQRSTNFRPLSFKGYSIPSRPQISTLLVLIYYLLCSVMHWLTLLLTIPFESSQHQWQWEVSPKSSHFWKVFLSFKRWMWVCFENWDTWDRQSLSIVISAVPLTLLASRLHLIALHLNCKYVPILWNSVWCRNLKVFAVCLVDSFLARDTRTFCARYCWLSNRNLRALGKYRSTFVAFVHVLFKIRSIQHIVCTLSAFMDSHTRIRPLTCARNSSLNIL